MAYDINAALERLEKNLSEVDSAKNQVEETIATSERLLQIIGSYSDSLDSLYKEVSKFVSEVHNYQSVKTSEFESAISKVRISCDGVIAKFNNDVKTSTDTFTAKFSDTVTKIGSENNKLAEQVSRLSTLHGALNTATDEVKKIESKLDVIAKDLKDSQAEQDRTLENIKSSLTALPTGVKSQLDNAISIINGHATDLNKKADEIKSEAATSIHKLDSVIAVLSETKTLCKGIKTGIADLKKSIESELVQTQSAINVNRWILIIGLIALITLHFIKL